jgi:hypothetical protein
MIPGMAQTQSEFSHLGFAQGAITNDFIHRMTKNLVIHPMNITFIRHRNNKYPAIPANYR